MEKFHGPCLRSQHFSLFICRCSEGEQARHVCRAGIPEPDAEHNSHMPRNTPKANIVCWTPCGQPGANNIGTKRTYRDVRYLSAFGMKRTSFAHGSKRCIALIALGEEPPLAYTIHHACLLVHHCLSVDSGCLRKEGGRISRTAWPSWASWPCRPPRWNGHSFRRWRMSPDLRGCVRG